VTEEELDRAEIGAGLKEVYGERVTKRMRRHRFGDATP
jgi:hypothetical protein